MVILPKTEVIVAENMINRVKKLFSLEKIGSSEYSISFGFEVKTNNDQDISELIKEAENKMYRQKLFESKSMRSNTIELIMKALYEKNSREMFHSRRVSEICGAIVIKI